MWIGWYLIVWLSNNNNKKLQEDKLGVKLTFIFISFFYFLVFVFLALWLFNDLPKVLIKGGDGMDWLIWLFLGIIVLFTTLTLIWVFILNRKVTKILLEKEKKEKINNK